MNNYSLKKPCKSCPFTKNNIFSKTKSLSLDRITQIIDDCVLGDNTFICHNTPENNSKLCAGALILYHKENENGNWIHRLSRKNGEYKPESMKNIDSVYESTKEMKEAYE